jgi:hypothetical protein
MSFLYRRKGVSFTAAVLLLVALKKNQYECGLATLIIGLATLILGKQSNPFFVLPGG